MESWFVTVPLQIFNIYKIPREDVFYKEQNITSMQMELNYDLDPRAQESEGEKRRISECLCLFSALCNSGAWELQQLGQALRNILSCNVNMPEL